MSECLGSQNTLALSDALVLVERVPTANVDLCYIDPPLFPTVARPDSLRGGASTGAHTLAMRNHLLSLASVLQQVKRCLAPTGNLFVHSEPEMNGSIRLLLDQVFERKNFRQEIVVPRPRSGPLTGPTAGHDTIFHFSVGPDYTLNLQTRQLSSEEIASQFAESDARGPYRRMSLVAPVVRPSLVFEWCSHRPPAGKSWRFSKEQLQKYAAEGLIILPLTSSLPTLKQYASESQGVDVGSVWDDIPLKISGEERQDYPTQKPGRLAERIIQMGSNSGGLVLDPYCGSGTSLAAAAKLGRRWIGGDNSPEAIPLGARQRFTCCSTLARLSK